MAKKKQEEAPKGSPAWMATFSDLMNLLLCFFVLLFSMSSVDESKAEAMIKSLADTFSIFSGGGESFEDGVLISSGATQLSNLDEYVNQSGQTDDGDSMENVNTDTNGAGEEGKKDNVQENPGNQMNTGESDQNPGDNNTSKPETDPSGQDKDHDKENDDVAPGGQDDKKASLDDIDIEDIKQAAANAELKENEELSGIILEEVTGLTDKFNIGDYVDIAIDAEQYEYVSININGTVLFDSGKAIIKDDAIAIISKLGDVLKQYRDYKIEVIGHTDNVPNGKHSDYPTNELLSSARAISVASFFAENKGMGWDNIYFAGRGEHEPIADNSTPEGRKQNRRVEIRLYNKKTSDK